jgi:hypothetical protein
MARNVDINLRARDSASGAIASVSKSVSRLPEQFSKSAAAMTVFGSAANEVGGKTAMAIGKFTQLGSLVATGGPVGIAIAAVTAAIGLATLAWEAHSSQAVASENAYRSLTGVIDQRTARLEAQRAAIMRLDEQIKYAGKTDQEIQEIKLKDQIIGQTKTIPQYKEEIARMRELAEEKLKGGVLQTYTTGLRGQEIKTQTIYVQKIKEEADALNAQADALERQLPGIEESARLNEKQLSLTREKIALDAKEKETAGKSKKQEKQQSTQAKDNASALAESQKYIDAERELAARRTAERVKESDKFRSTWNGAISDVAKDWLAMWDEELRLQTAAVEQSERDADSMKAKFGQVAESVAGVMGDAFAQMILDSDNAALTMSRAVIQAAKTAVMAYAAAGAAASAFANAGIPGMGWIMAITGATAVFGLIEGLLSKIPSMDVGGTVPGPRGAPTLILAHGQEEVLRPDEAKEYRKGGGRQIVFNTVIPDTGAEMMRKIYNVNKVNMRLARLGY